MFCFERYARPVAIRKLSIVIDLRSSTYKIYKWLVLHGDYGNVDNKKNTSTKSPADGNLPSKHSPRIGSSGAGTGVGGSGSLLTRNVAKFRPTVSIPNYPRNI